MVFVLLPSVKLHGRYLSMYDLNTPNPPSIALILSLGLSLPCAFPYTHLCALHDHISMHATIIDLSMIHDVSQLYLTA